MMWRVRSRVPLRAVAAVVTAVAATLLVATAPSADEEAYDWPLPKWVPRPVVPDDNPMTAAKVELGRHLFYDRRLSANGTQSCATCHEQARAFTDGKAVATGITGEVGAKSAMSLANVAWLPALTWSNPNLDSLEVQALVPVFGEHPVEMGMAGREAELFARLQADPVYRRLFPAAFPDEARRGDAALYSLSTLTKALASFERRLVSFDSAFDRYRYGGDRGALSDAAKRGEALFFGERLECYHCHGGFTFTDNVKHVRLKQPEVGFHNTGLYNEDGAGAYPAAAPGLVEVTGEPRDAGRFRTPTLRNVTQTAPYMHDGSIATLEDVIRRHYAKAGRAVDQGLDANPLRSEFLAGFEIDDAEVADLVAFLDGLTDRTFLADPALADPWPR